jgi:hypothetical protein
LVARRNGSYRDLRQLVAVCFKQLAKYLPPDADAGMVTAGRPQPDATVAHMAPVKAAKVSNVEIPG